ncbi:MAG: glucosamine-6-phosphate deaminase [Planctomycetota bacterium]|nr:glucosamine-6-phosphate deaminase [Planctomycetota bacterium]
MAAPLKTFSVDSLAVRVFAATRDMAVDAAREARQVLCDAVAARGAAAAILAGGNSQRQFLEELVAAKGVDWSRVTLFHMDEYLGMPVTHSASLRRQMRERVESKVKPKKFEYLAGDAMEPLTECERYAALLKAQPLDLCCLGIGENGHVAFNDPAVADFNDPRLVKIVKLDRPCRQQQVGEGHFSDIEAVPQYALTLTIPALCAARKVLAIAPEKRKAEPVKNTLRGPISTTCPASYLRKQAHCTLFLDAESASLI